MARGRLISRTLGSSRKYAALLRHAGKLGEFCQVLYPLLVAHSDDFGRLAGDAFTVKHAVFPTSPRREPDFRAALVSLHQMGLIRLYETPGSEIVIQIERFAEHQPGLSKKTRSRFPEPPVNFTEFRELPLQLKGIEEKGTEEKRREPIRSPDEPGTAEGDRRKEENREVAAFIARFCEFYKRHRHGAVYFIVREKHVPLVRALLGVYGRDRLEKLALVLLRTDDEWVDGTDRGIGILSTKASWLDGKLAEYEAQHGPITVAS